MYNISHNKFNILNAHLNILGEMSMEISKQIGQNLKSLRVSRNLSLDKLAYLTGVSKAMLGQIERGDTNPTVSTLWKIANGLKVSFTSLVREEEKHIQLVKRIDGRSISEEEGHYRVYPVFPFHQERHFELFTVELDADYSHLAEPHHDGVEEYITVMDGELYIAIQDTEYHLSTGDSVRFSANVQHQYINKDKAQMAVFSLFISYPCS